MTWVDWRILSWVVTAFMVASTMTTPLYGKLSDIFGRKPAFFVSILIFLAGSVLCGLSRSMTQLIVFRAVQGLGAGGLITLSQTVVGDRYQGCSPACSRPAAWPGHCWAG